MILAFAASAVATLLANTPAPMSTSVVKPPEARLLKAQFGGNATCFKSGEQSQGMTKICYYDCLGSPAAITITATSLCPLTIKR